MDEKSMADPNNIREMNLETDLERVKEIWLQEVKKTHKSFIKENSWDLSVFENEIKNQECYVYEENRTIKGFITAGNLNELPYIYELYVDSKHQVQGIGSKLLDKLQGKHSVLTTHVYVGSIDAINWYLVREFVIGGIHDSDPNHPEQLKYLMVWTKPLFTYDRLR